MCHQRQEDIGFLKADGQGGHPSAKDITTKYCKISAVQPTSSSIYCQIDVEGVPTRFMADTGAEITLLPCHHGAVTSFREKLKPTTVQPVTVDGKPIPLLGTLELTVKMGELSGSVTFYVTSDPGITPILGLDVMRRMQRVEIDFTKGDKITFGPLSAPQPDIQKTPVIRKISVNLLTDVVVPPRHEMIVQGCLKVKEPSEFSQLDKETLLVEPTNCDQDIVWGRSLGTVNKGVIPLRVCNSSRAPVNLHAGTTVGEAEVLPEHPVIAVVSDEIMTAEAVDRGDSDKAIMDLVNRTNLPDKEKETVRQSLQRLQAVFSFDGELGRYEDQLFNINTGDAAPIRSMPRPVPHHKKIEVDRQLDEMLRRGLIKASNSAWASPILMVKKKDGSLRFCIDYRKLNDVTKHDSFPLPNIQDCLSSLSGQCYRFSSLDMASGYWQIGMDPESQEKAAFTTHRGLFQPLVQPFGPKGGVAHFSRVMNSLLGSMQWKQLLIYLDDILVFGKDFEEHLQRLETVFATLIKANLKLKPAKCHLFQETVPFLGHVISPKGISPSGEKTNAVQSWPVPTTKDQLQSFLGLASFYRRFVKDFATIVEPLNRLTRKQVSFDWDVHCQKSFDCLKDALVKHPVLAYPDFTQKFILTTDVSMVGIGAILSQMSGGHEKVIAYASRTLSKAERNYSATERECLGVVWATDHFKYYLLGAPFVIYTDHNPLTYLRSVSQPQGKLARWILKLEQYDYELRYKPGKQIPHADALSRHPVHVAAVELPTEWTTEEFREIQEKDPVLRKVKYYWRLNRQPPSSEDAAVRTYCKKLDLILEEDGVLKIKYSAEKRLKKQWLVPEVLVPRVLEKAHDDAGHFGTDKTLPRIRQLYYWPSLWKDVTRWCRSCDKCQKRKHPSMLPKAPLQYFPIASAPGQHVAMDFVGPLVESTQGNLHILVVTDTYSKFAEAIPLPNQSAETTANALWFRYFCRHGVPSILHSDQGKNFESAIVKHLCDNLGIQKTRTSGYHPAGNGNVERYNKTLVERLSLLIEQDDQKDWEKHIPQAVFDYHSTPHASTGLTPFELHLGRQLKSPFDMLMRPAEETKNKSVADYIASYEKNRKIQHTIAKDNLQHSMEQRKVSYDKKLCYTPYQQGDLVLCRNYACKKGLKPKLMRERWTGPWKIDKLKGPVNYRITMRKGPKRLRLLVHHDRLKPYEERPGHLSPQRSSEENQTAEAASVEEEEGKVEEGPQAQPSDNQDESDLSEDEEFYDVEEQANQDVEQAAVQDPVERPEPIMGHRGEKWCNVDPVNMVDGPRRRRQ